MLKIDCFFFRIENEFIFEDGIFVLDLLRLVSNFKEFFDIIFIVILVNEFILEVEVVENEDVIVVEDVVLEVYKIGNIVVLNEDMDVFLCNIFISKVGDMLEDEIVKEYIEILEDVGVVKLYLEILEEIGVLKLFLEILKEVGVVKLYLEILDEDDFVKKDIEILMQDDDILEYI